MGPLGTTVATILLFPTGAGRSSCVCVSKKTGCLLAFGLPGSQRRGLGASRGRQQLWPSSSEAKVPPPPARPGC